MTFSERASREDIKTDDRPVFFDLNVYLPDDLLVKMDIASMANSLETRAPFLDYELVELAKLIFP